MGYKTGSNIFSSPSIGSQHIYFGSQDGYLYAFGLENSKGELYGKVSDWGTLSPITNATISTNGVVDTYSGSDGNYGIALNAGVYDVTISKAGYQTATVYNLVITAGESTELNIELNVDGPLNIVTTDLEPAEISEEYNSRIRISGGISPYRYSIVYGFMPPGLSLDAGNGNITGIATTTGSYTFAIGVTDGQGAYAEREFSIEVTEQFEITSESTLPRPTRDTDYFFSIEATGGALPHTFAKTSGSLPPGMFVSSSGNLSGTASTSGSYDFTVRVTDDSGRTAEKAFHLEIDNPLVITTTRLNHSIAGEAYNQIMSASGGYGTYRWEVYSGILPAGLSLDGESAVLSGTPTQATCRTIVFSVSDEEGRITYKDFTLQVSDPVQILTATLPNGLIDASFSEAIRVSGGIEPFTFSRTGQLPAGLSLNTSTGIISGTPTTAGYTNVDITVVDSTYPTSQSATQSLGIRITPDLTILTCAVLPNGKKDVEINPIILVAGGGPSPYEWSLVDGIPPAGITLDSQTGGLFGTPAGKGDFVFTIQVTDANSATAQKEFFWHISDTLSIVTGAIPDGGKGVLYSFALDARGGLLPYTWRKKSGTFPTGLSINPITGMIYGTPTTTQTTVSFTIEVSDNDSPAQTAEHTYIMEVLDELYVYTKTIPNGRTDEAYTATIRASLGKPPYEWRLESGNLPPGLKLNSSPTVATLEGTPTQAGIYVFTLEVTDTGTPVKHATREYTVEIYGDVTIQTSVLQSAIRGVDYSESIVVSGGDLPYIWAIIGGSLPEELALNSTSGHISGTALETAQSSTFTVRVTDSGDPAGFDEKEFVIHVIDWLEIVTQTIQGVLQNFYYRATLEGDGGISPYHWSIEDGNLPEGLQLDSGTGVISGTPVRCGPFAFTVRVEDSAPVPNTDTHAYNLEVLCCTGAALDMDISTRDYDDTVSSTDIESTAWVHENGELWIGVVAQGVTDLDTYQVEVSFDTARVEFVEGIEDNPPEGIVNLLKKNGGATVGFQAVEIANGTVSIANALLGSDCNEAPEGSGVIALLKFRVLDTDPENQPTLGNVYFVNCNGDEQEITNLTNGGFIESPPWNFNSDGIVNYLDLGLLADHWLFIDDDPDWDPKYNLSSVPEQGSGKQIINYLDLGMFADHWLEETQ